MSKKKKHIRHKEEEREEEWSTREKRRKVEMVQKALSDAMFIFLPTLGNREEGTLREGKSSKT